MGKVFQTRTRLLAMSAMASRVPSESTLWALARVVALTVPPAFDPFDAKSAWPSTRSAGVSGEVGSVFQTRTRFWLMTTSRVPSDHGAEQAPCPKSEELVGLLIVSMSGWPMTSAGAVPGVAGIPL